MPAKFPATVKQLARAINNISIEIYEFHVDHGSYTLYTYVQYNEPGKPQRTTPPQPLGVFTHDEAERIWNEKCGSGFAPAQD